MDSVEVCNIALSRLGVGLIESLKEASEAARACKQFYDHARRVVLRRYDWTFATRRVSLALLPTAPKDYKYAYRYPSRCIYLRKLYNEEFDNIPAFTDYKIVSDSEGRVIYTNIKNVCAEFTADIEDVGLFDEQFIEILSWKLAAEIAFKLTGNMQVSQMAEQQYNNLFLEAVANNENEQNIKHAAPYTFAGARFIGLGLDGEL